MKQDRLALKKRWKGYMPALITPFDAQGEIDVQALAKLIKRQEASGIKAIVLAGTTGESATFSDAERSLVLEQGRKNVSDQVSLMMGIGSNDTRTAIKYAQDSKTQGADSLLSTTPYYNKPTQEGLYTHFMKVADATDLPLFLYNVPGRTGVDLKPATVARLAKHPNIVGIKDATGDLVRPLQHVDSVKDDNFIMLSGEDATALSFFINGGVGAISVTANVLPAACARLFSLWESKQIKEAMELQQKLYPLHDAMFVETSPAPAKYALSCLGLCSDNLRLPLVQMSDENKERVKKLVLELQDLGINSK